MTVESVLTPKQQTVMDMRREGLTVKQIAEILDRHEVHVRRLMTQARKREEAWGR